MNKKIILLSTIFFLCLLTINPVKAQNYTIQCTRPCTSYIEECETYTNTLAFTQSAWSWNPQTFPYNKSQKSIWQITPDNSYGNYDNCNFYEYVNGGTYGCAGSCVFNWTHALITTTTTWDAYSCTNQTLIMTCDNDERKTNGIVIEYDTTDGSCSGNIIGTYPNDWTGVHNLCEGDWEFASSNDKAYASERYDFAQGTGTCYASSTTLASGSPATLDCEVQCDGTAYSLYQKHEVLAGNPTSSFTMTLQGNHTYDTCTEQGIQCLSYGTPDNTTLTQGCDCLSGQTDYGLFCDGQDCNLTCSGTIGAYTTNQTGEILLSSGDPEDALTFFGNEVTGFFTNASSGLSQILWVMVILAFIVAVILIATYLTTGWL